MLDVVISQCAVVCQVFPAVGQALLVGGDTFFILHRLFDTVDRIVGFHVERDRRACERLHEYLHDAVLVLVPLFFVVLALVSVVELVAVAVVELPAQLVAQELVTLVPTPVFEKLTVAPVTLMVVITAATVLIPGSST